MSVEVVRYQGTKGEFDAIKQIFFLSSDRQDFASEDERTLFFEHWCRLYFDQFSDQIYLAKIGRQVVGYLFGCANSSLAVDYFSANLQSPLVFQDCFVRFPAHLHLNVHPDFRGQAIGQMLVTAFATELGKSKVPGVHVVTSPISRNVGFYERLGFRFKLERNWKTHPLLFMGRDLPKI